MKKNFLKLAALSMCAIATLTSCDSSNKGNEFVADLSGEISKDLTLEAGKTYTLNGGVKVLPGVTLTIEKGVTIIAHDDKVVDFILVQQGATIDACGTADEPIVMTSEYKQHGAWGGLHICGKAPINIPFADAVSEVGESSYGGTNPADNSGVLSYIRVEYAGYCYTEDKEANGFTFYGVGSGTQIDHLQAYKGADDGYEWFGGTAKFSYLVSTDNQDDSFDWTYGFCGEGQFLVANQLSAACDHLMEGDSNKTAGLTPVSKPVFSNVTLIGVNSGTTEEPANRGIRVRRDCQIELYNAIIVGKTHSINAQSDGTENYLKDNMDNVMGVYMSGDVSSDNDIFTTSIFESESSNHANHNIDIDMQSCVGTLAGVQVNGLVETTNYAGAVSADDNWLAEGNWVRLQ